MILTRSDERWEDPIPPGMFSPADETVASILERANRKPIHQKAHRNRLAVSVAVMAFIVIGCAVGIRLLETMWGETVLPRGGALSSPKVANGAQSPEAQPQAAAPTAMIAGAGENTSKDGNSMETATASPTAVPVIGADEGTQASSSSAGSPYGLPPSAVSSNVSRLAALCAEADVIVAGQFDSAGLFIIEEQLKGDCPGRITIEKAASFRGWAVVFLTEKNGGWSFSQEPFLFRAEAGLLSARDASGAPVEYFDLGGEVLSLDTLRELLFN